MATDHDTQGVGDPISAVSALGEPTRRRIYDHVVRAAGWVSRDDVADAVDIERGTSAHHLDRLAADGLLEVDFQRLTGRTGPGAGRPAKMYRRVERDISVALPPRDYRLAAELLAEAADRSLTKGIELQAALDETASDRGRHWGELLRSGLQGANARRAATRREAVVDFLEEQGYEPDTVDDGSVTLRNCPFDRLASNHTDLVCGMNMCLLDTTVEHVGRTGVKASLEPSEVNCCVTLRPR